MNPIDEPALRAQIAETRAAVARLEAKTDTRDWQGTYLLELADACEALLDDPVRRAVKHGRFRSLSQWQDTEGEWRATCGFAVESYKVQHVEGQQPYGSCTEIEAACAAALAAMEKAK